MESMGNPMPRSAGVRVVLVILVTAVLAAAQGTPPDVNPDTGSGDVVTMAKMRSLVPSLVALGWDDFFLNSRNQIGLSPDQVRSLLAFRLAFLVDAEHLTDRIREAEMALYEEVDRDQVSAKQIEVRVRTLTGLRAELLTLRFRALLRAVNTLNHKQHQRLAAFLVLQAPSMSQQQARPPAFRNLGYPNAGWLSTDVQRCGSLPFISVDALRSRTLGRDAAGRLMRAAEQLQKLVKSAPFDWDAAREVLATTEPDLALLRWTREVLQPFTARASGVPADQLELQLSPEPLISELDRIRAHLNGDMSEAAALGERATHLKDLAKQWRRALDRVDDALCLAGRPLHPQTGIGDTAADQWWEADAGRIARPKAVPHE